MKKTNMSSSLQAAESIEMPSLHGKAEAAPEGSKEKHLSPEDGVSRKRSRGLLRVPSRTSSQRLQGSPTGTGMSGATAGDGRDSIGGTSKESKGSMMGRRRNGSASSNHSGVATGATNTPADTQPSSPASSRQKKKSGGLFSLLGCCGVPDDEPIPAHKLDKIPARPTTASRHTGTPSEQNQSKSQLAEKEPQGGPAHGQESFKAGNRASASSMQDQSTVGDKETESKQTTLVGGAGPVVTVDPPIAGSADHHDHMDQDLSRDGDGDVEMPDAGPVSAQKQPALEEQDHLTKLPPPPPPPGPPQTPVPTPAVPENSVSASPEQVPQKYLLPPIAPHMKGRKCLVLDLDETLVHSSFKVRYTDTRSSHHLTLPPPNEFPANPFADTSPGRLYHPRGNRGQLSQRLRNKAARCRSVHEASWRALRSCCLHGLRIQGKP